MDLLCPRCGEPWDNDTFHEVAAEKGTTYREVIRDFQARGCIATGWMDRVCERDPKRAPAISAMYDLLGDDTDGAAAMFEDFAI